MRPSTCRVADRSRRGKLLADRFDERTLRHHAVFRIAPQGEEQFARARHQPDPSQAATTIKSASRPLRERAGRLMLEPGPRELDHDPSHLRVAGARDPGIPRHLTALRRGRRQADQAAQLPRVANLPPAKDFRRQDPRPDGADAAQGRESLDAPPHRRGRLRPDRGAHLRQLPAWFVDDRALRPDLREPRLQTGRHWAAIPEARRLHVGDDVLSDRDPDPLRQQEALQATSQPRPIPLPRVPAPMHLARVLLDDARHTYDAPHSPIPEQTARQEIESPG